MSDQQRREAFLAYFQEKLRGDRQRLIEKARITKGRVTQLLDPSEPFGEKAARTLGEKLEPADPLIFLRAAGIEPLPHSQKGVAHPMRLVPSDDPPRINWGDVLNSTDERFSVQIQDDAMAPRIVAGTWVRFLRTTDARPGDGVLVRDQHDNLYFRVLRQRTPGHWLAVADNTNFEPLDSLADELQVVGVLIGVDQRWG